MRFSYAIRMINDQRTNNRTLIQGGISEKPEKLHVGLNQRKVFKFDNKLPFKGFYGFAIFCAYKRAYYPVGQLGNKKST